MSAPDPRDAHPAFAPARAYWLDVARAQWPGRERWAQYVATALARSSVRFQTLAR